MKILRHGVLLCFLASTFAAPAPKRQGIDIEKTVAQVEQVLRQNTNLPRLSREDILQLLNDIRAEDEKSASASTEISGERVVDISEREKERIEFNEINDEDHNSDLSLAASSPPKLTKSSARRESLMVVLPYTPKDGTSLQELFTRPPRVALLRAPAPMRASDGDRQESNDVPVPETVQPLNKTVRVPKPESRQTTAKPRQEQQWQTKIKQDLTKQTPENPAQVKKGERNTTAPVPVEYPDIAADLREFLNQHGLHGNSGTPDDHFLLPLDGFKPLPPIRDIDGSVDLPEKILLTYDLSSPPVDHVYAGPYDPDLYPVNLPLETVVYDPIRPDFDFELGLPSNQKETVLPLDSPNRIRKAVDNKPDYSPIDYDSEKVIPLNSGPNPLDLVSQSDPIDFEKRQTENATSTAAPSSEPPVTEATAVEINSETNLSSEASPKFSFNASTVLSESNDSASADSSDAGASIADLENSFGAPAPMDPSESELPPPRKNGFYWMLDWNSFLEVGDGDEKVNIRFEPKLGDPQMFLPVTVP